MATYGLKKANFLNKSHMDFMVNWQETTSEALAHATVKHCRRCGDVLQGRPYFLRETDVCLGCYELEQEIYKAHTELIEQTQFSVIAAFLWQVTVAEAQDANAKAAQETKSMLARINAPERVAARGTALTPYGWRKVTPRASRIKIAVESGDDEFVWGADPDMGDI